MKPSVTKIPILLKEDKDNTSAIRIVGKRREEITEKRKRGRLKKKM